MDKSKQVIALVAVAALAVVGCGGSGAATTAPASAAAASNAPASVEASQGSAGGTYTYTSDQEGIASIEGVKLNDAGPVAAGSGERIAVVLKALNNQYWQGIQQGVEAAAKDFGVEVSLQAASSESAQSEQLTIAQTMVNDKYDAYVFAPESSSNLTPAIQAVQEQGLPLVNVDDARVPATVYVGPDHKLDGTQAAEYIGKQNPDGGQVAQIEGQAGSSAAILRIEGFKEGVAANPKLNLVSSVPGDWSADKAFAATQQILQQYPDLVGIYANNDTMAVGVAKAVGEAGKTDQITIVGTDGVPEAINNIREGTMAATVSPLPYYQGYWALESAVRLLRGQDVVPWVVAPAQLIDAANVDEYYGADGLVKQGLYK